MAEAGRLKQSETIDAEGGKGALVPVYLATISCTTLATAPVTCTITIQWAENAVALDSKQSNLAGLQAPTYTLLVQP